MSRLVLYLMRVLVAVLLALAIIAAQFVYGGLMRTVFSFPCFVLLAGAGILGGAAGFWKRAGAPRPEAVVATLRAGGFSFGGGLDACGQGLARLA